MKLGLSKNQKRVIAYVFRELSLIEQPGSRFSGILRKAEGQDFIESVRKGLPDSSDIRHTYQVVRRYNWKGGEQ